MDYWCRVYREYVKYSFVKKICIAAAKYFYRPYPTLHTMCVIVRMRYLLVD
jgi:hypothetical protein